jgi:hypothetical protein
VDKGEGLLHGSRLVSIVFDMREGAQATQTLQEPTQVPVTLPTDSGTGLWGASLLAPSVVGCCVVSFLLDAVEASSPSSPLRAVTDKTQPASQPASQPDLKRRRARHCLKRCSTATADRHHTARLGWLAAILPDCVVDHICHLPPDDEICC